SSDEMVSRTRRIDLLPQCDDSRVVDVIPLHTGAGVQPEHPAVQAAAEVHHGAALVNSQELGGPDVVLRGAHRNQRRPPASYPDLTPVVVESTDSFLRVPVAEDGALEIGVERLEIQSGQHGLRCASEVDGSLDGHAFKSSVREIAGIDGRCRQTNPALFLVGLPAAVGAVAGDTGACLALAG